jgi:hypothetical protein
MDQPVRIRRVLIVADDDFAGVPGGRYAMALGRGCGWAGREF